MIQPTLILAATTSAVGDVHRSFGWYAVWLMGGVGLWGLVLAIRKRDPGRSFWALFGLAVVGILTQVGMGTWALSVDGVDPGNQHVFYGVVIVFTLSFAYIYRAQLAKRPALSYAILALFLMGLAIRAISNFGQSF
jgi:hypothetical protein